MAFRNEAAEESQQQVIAQVKIAAEQRFAFQTEGHKFETDQFKIAATHDREITIARLENQARLASAQPVGQNRTNLTEAEQSLADRSDNAVASLNKLHCEEINRIIADYERQFAAMDDEARGKGRQHEIHIAEYKRKVELANNAVGDELAGKILLMQEEHAKEPRSIREETNATIHGAIRNNAAMDAKHLEEKQSLQGHFAVLSRNAHEEKQIAIARLSAKLQVSDNRFSALQEYRDKYRQMMNENSIPRRQSEPVIPPVVQNSGMPRVGAHPAGTNSIKRPTESNDLGPPASDSGPSEGRRRWGGPPGGSDPDPHEPPGRAPDIISDSKKSKASNIIVKPLSG